MVAQRSRPKPPQSWPKRRQSKRCRSPPVHWRSPPVSSPQSLPVKRPAPAFAQTPPAKPRRRVECLFAVRPARSSARSDSSAAASAASAGAARGAGRHPRRRMRLAVAVPMRLRRSAPEIFRPSTISIDGSQARCLPTHAHSMHVAREILLGRRTTTVHIERRGARCALRHRCGIRRLVWSWRAEERGRTAAAGRRAREPGQPKHRSPWAEAGWRRAAEQPRQSPANAAWRRRLRSRRTRLDRRFRDGGR